MRGFIKITRDFFNRWVGDLSIHTFALNEYSFEKAKTIVQYYYYILVFLSVWYLPSFETYLLRENFSPIWSISWARYVPYPTVIWLIMAFFIGSALIGTLFYWNRIARIFSFLGVLEYHAFLSSFGQPNHQWYLWLYISLLFTFLPDGWGEKGQALGERKKFLLIFWGTQAFVLLTYSMSGLAKVYSLIAQITSGQLHALAPEGFATQIAYWLSRMQSTSLLGPFIIDNPWVGVPLMGASIYLLFFAFFAAFRPSIQRPFAVGFILFHVGTYLTMKILFEPRILPVLILFFDSPFRTIPTSWQKIVSDLPLIGFTWKYSFGRLWPEKFSKDVTRF